VHQTFDAWFQLNERAVVRNAGNLTGQSRVLRKTLFDRFPRVWQKLFVTQRDALARTIKAQHLDLDGVTNTEKLSRILQSSPRHISHVQQPINAARSTNAP